MTAPMFTKSIEFGSLCRACDEARRRLTVCGSAHKIYLSEIRAGCLLWYACLVCDQSPEEAPAWQVDLERMFTEIASELDWPKDY